MLQYYLGYNSGLCVLSGHFLEMMRIVMPFLLGFLFYFASLLILTGYQKLCKKLPLCSQQRNGMGVRL